ncbi:hypothetical protein M8C13_32715 [Crossiella sp. SN42]|nr:hypothetical protein [Crossiella sp. SN42]MCO1580528.1 hypothetical protein [Crossiella sp. SN42]
MLWVEAAPDADGLAGGHRVAQALPTHRAGSTDLDRQLGARAELVGLPVTGFETAGTVPRPAGRVLGPAPQDRSVAQGTRLAAG